MGGGIAVLRVFGYATAIPLSAGGDALYAFRNDQGVPPLAYGLSHHRTQSYHNPHECLEGERGVTTSRLGVGGCTCLRTTKGGLMVITAMSMVMITLLGLVVILMMATPLVMVMVPIYLMITIMVMDTICHIHLGHR